MKTWIVIGVLSVSFAPSLFAPTSPITVRFDQPRYDITPGETFLAHVVIDPPPDSGLTSQGIKASFPSAQAQVTNLAGITTPAALDFNGSQGAGAIRALSNDFAAVKGTVDFSQMPLVPYLGAELGAFRITDSGHGSYVLTLDAYRTFGAAEHVFLDGNGNVIDDQITFGTAQVNYRPTVQIVTPTNGAIVRAPTNLLIVAEAQDPDGLITLVEFFEGTNKIGEAASLPFSTIWANIPVGPHTIFAVATDDQGAQTQSAPVSFTVTAPPTGIYALFGYESGQAAGAGVVVWRGTSNTVSGRVHSNSDIDAAGDSHRFRNGSVQYVSGITPDPIPPAVAQFENAPLGPGAVEPYPVDYTPAEFAPAGATAAAAIAAGKYYHISGDTTLADHLVGSTLQDGLYYVEGNVSLGHHALSGQVTIVATGNIEVTSCNSSFEPYVRCLLLYSTHATDRYQSNSIDVTVASDHLRGVIFAPGGGIECNSVGQTTLIGSLIGRAVTVEGIGFTLVGIDPATCQAPAGLLTPHVVANRLELHVATLPNLSYEVEAADTLGSTSWKLLKELRGDGSVQKLPISQDLPATFFRLRIR